MRLFEEAVRDVKVGDFGALRIARKGMAAA
jgi:hypothetical protein